MSVKLRFVSPSEGSLVHRSRSFTGFSSGTGRRWSSSGNSIRSKATTGGKSPRMHLTPGRGGGALWAQVDRVFQALCKGLRDFLQAHQAEMDFLSSQQTESRRNSRLGFLYDLEKEIRTLERFIRRLEFQISKVEELHEMFWIQWRLCQGVMNMRRAFSLSPSTRASRESLLELSRNHRHSLQDMSVMEDQLEILLGELHVKMKGLIGFARLCPGDQYEVEVRLGRQRWRIRGRIQSDDKQFWDEEEMIFLPHIHQNFQIKVTEAKGFGWLLVGMVTCESADFFVAKPRLMLVDITELGTLKLQLEVTWTPFDGGEKTSLLSVGRQFVPSRKSSVYTWTAPSTPSFTEKYLKSMVRDLQDGEDPLQFQVSKGRQNRGDVSLLSYSPERSQTSRTSAPSPQSPPDLSFNTPDILRKSTAGEPEPEIHSPDPGPEAASVQDRPGSQSDSASEPARPAAQPPAVTPTISTDPVKGGERVTGAQRRVQAMRLGALMAELEKIFQNQNCSEKELRALDQQILHLATILKNDLSLLRSSSSEETLAVEEVLGSFDFLSRDFNTDDDTSSGGSLRVKDSGFSSFQKSMLSSLRLHSQDSQSASEEDLLITPLTSGNWGLDQTLETHLDICCILLQMMRTTTFSPARRELLQEMALQTEVLDRVSGLLLEKNDDISAGDLLPSAQGMRDVLWFWSECVSDSGSVFCCSSDTFCRTLKKRYIHKVKAKQPGQAEKVFTRFLQLLQASNRIVPDARPICSPERVTLLQLSIHLKRWNVQELGEHISRLSREEYILSGLKSPKRRRALNKMRGQSITELLPLGITLQTLAALQIDSNHRVCKAAANCLCRSSGCKTFRSKAVVYYTASLRSSDVQIQLGSCLALKCLRASESVENIADVWRSADEDLRGAVKETVLSFGRKGFLSFQRMEQLHAEMEEELYQNQETQITYL